VTATAARLSAFVAVAFAVTLAVLWLSSREDTPKPLPPHVAVAPKAQHGPQAHGTVFGTGESAQEVADSAIEGTVGPGGRRPDITPLAPAAFRGPIARYRTYAVREARTLARQTHALTAALRSGDRAGARRDWLAAYATYLRIGAAYGALGALDDAIEGRGRGLHEIESGLWTGERPAALVPAARGVQHVVARLPHALRTGPITPLDYATRAHEILEDDQRDQLSNAAPRWSGASVLATAAELAATRVVIGTLHGVLAGRGDVLPQVETRLAELGRVLARLRRAHGGWPPVARLTRTEHEQLTATLGATLETLSTVPGALETALPPVIPAIR
jgi:iron uptake system EfeUOB component EfeO/EfeM